MSKEKNMKKSSTILKDAFILFLITLAAGFALGLVHEVTLPVIEQRHLKTKQDAYKSVFPNASEFVEDVTLSKLAETAQEDILKHKGYTNITIDEVRIAKDSMGITLGYVVMSTTQEGYGGVITVLLGYTHKGVVNGMEILTINETAGLGSKAAGQDFKAQYSEKEVTEFIYTKTGATKENEIDVISGATITTRAVTNAVNSGIIFITASVGNHTGGEKIE